MTDAEFKALAARSLHESEGAETDESVREQNSGGVIELSTFNWSAQMSSSGGKCLYLVDLNDHEIAVINRKQLSELIALLQRARAIMAGGA